LVVSRNLPENFVADITSVCNDFFIEGRNKPKIPLKNSQSTSFQIVE